MPINQIQKVTPRPLPKSKEQELKIIKDTIIEHGKDVEMIILFGCYSRVTWKEESDLIMIF